MRVTNVFVLLVLICAAVGQELPKPEATWLPLSEMDEVRLKGNVLVDEASEVKKEFEDLEKRGKLLEKKCFSGVCFQLVQPAYSYNDYDCGCPTMATYYKPLSFSENGVTWYPVYPQFVKTGKCLSVNQVCHKTSWPFTYQKCRQEYQWVMFVYYRRWYGGIQLKLKYVSLPDYCRCPCGKLTPPSAE